MPRCPTAGKVTVGLTYVALAMRHRFSCLSTFGLNEHPAYTPLRRTAPFNKLHLYTTHNRTCASNDCQRCRCWCSSGSCGRRTNMKTLKDVARWTVCQLRVLYCVVQVLVGALAMWLLCHIPSMKDRLFAAHRRAMKSYTGGNWEVHISYIFCSKVSHTNSKHK